MWCWRRLLRVPWTARRSNQSILKEISPGCSLERMMVKLQLQYFGHLMWRVDSLEKTLMLGGIGSRRKRGGQSMRWLDGITDSGVGDGQGGLACCDSWGRKESDTTERLNWIELNWIPKMVAFILLSFIIQNMEMKKISSGMWEALIYSKSKFHWLYTSAVKNQYTYYLKFLKWI